MSTPQPSEANEQPDRWPIRSQAEEDFDDEPWRHGPRSEVTRQYLQNIALQHNILLICILLYLPCLILYVAGFQEWILPAVVFILIESLICVVILGSLSVDFDQNHALSFCTLLIIVPGLGFVVMLCWYICTIIVLHHHGVRVGLFGAKVSEI
jgi:hypothetical protein